MLILKSPSIFKSNFTCKVIFSKVKKKSWRTYFEVECPGPNHLPNWSRHQIVEGSAVSLKLVALKRQKMRTTHAALLWRAKIFCPICCWTQKCIIFTLKTTSHCGQITILDYWKFVILNYGRNDDFDFPIFSVKIFHISRIFFPNIFPWFFP